MPAKNIPDKGELVVCTVEKAKGFGAFVKLEEYPNLEGFIHIKEVAPGWIKNIRNHVKAGQRVVCKVMDVEPSKDSVDLSLKRVNDHQRRNKIQQWKNESKAENLLRIVADRLGKNFEDCLEEFGYDLVQKYGSLYEAFEEASYDEEALKNEGFTGDWMETFIEVAQENIVIPHVTITGYVELFSPAQDGIKHIKNALKKIQMEDDDVTINVKYVSAPLYRIDVTAHDYKLAETKMREMAEQGIAHLEEHDGTGQFKRELE